MFLITGWWQTVTSDDNQERDGGFLHELMKKFSSVHTDATWPRANAHHHPWVMKVLIVAMCIALMLSILLGLFMAWQVIKNKWRVVLTLVLGFLVPALILFFY